MADQKTTTKYVRAIKGFNHPQGHRRAGAVFMPGPAPQRLELTDEQIKMIEDDAVLEFVSQSEVDRVAGVESSDDSAPDAATSGRRYADSRPAGDGQPEDLSSMNREKLNALASEAGVDAPESLPNKQAVVDAIEAKRAADEDSDDNLGGFDLDGEHYQAKEGENGEAVYYCGEKEITREDYEAAAELAKQ